MSSNLPQQKLADVIENIVNESSASRLSALEEYKRQAERTGATEADIKHLEGLINTKHSELREFIVKQLSDSEKTTLKRFVQLWVTLAGALFALLTTILSAVSARLFPLP